MSANAFLFVLVPYLYISTLVDLIHRVLLKFSQEEFLQKHHSSTGMLSLTNGFCWFSQNAAGQFQTISLAQNILLPLLSEVVCFHDLPLRTGPQSKQQTHTLYHICFLTYITFYFTVNLRHKSESQQQQPRQQQRRAETEGQQRVDPEGLRLPVFPP